MAIFTSVLTGGVNNHETTAEAINAQATDFVTAGVIAPITDTSGVAPMTGAYAVNAQGTPDMTVAVSSGVAYVTGTPTGQNSQTLRIRSTASENVTITANSSGSTKYDWIYLSIDPDNAADPNSSGDNVTTLVTSRSTSSSSDDGTPPTYGLALAVVTVANGASSITNGNIAEKRVITTNTPDNSITTAKLADASVTPSKLALGPQTASVDTSQSTTSTSFTDLSTAGPAVTVTIGANGIALVTLTALTDSATVGNRKDMAFAVSGANTIAVNTNMMLRTSTSSGGSSIFCSSTFLMTGLNAGSTTFTAKYRRGGGDGSSIFANRTISVVPL
jgi:hypothetical protein